MCSQDEIFYFAKIFPPGICLRKASMLIMYVHDKIISNQNIRRMMYYNTKNPLSKIGLTYNGKEISQPDVEEDQVKDLITDLPFSPKGNG